MHFRLVLCDRWPLTSFDPLRHTALHCSTPNGMHFRLVLWDGEAYITSGGLRRGSGHHHQGGRWAVGGAERAGKAGWVAVTAEG